MTRRYEEELSISIKLGKLIGAKTLLIYDLIELFNKYDMIEEKLDCWFLLDKEKPFDVDIMYNIAECYVELADYSNVEKWYNKISEVTNDHDLHLFLKLGEILIMSTDEYKMRKGIQYLEKALTIDSENTDVLFVLIRGCYELNEFEKQVKYSKMFLKIEPDDQRVSSMLEDIEGKY